MIDDLHIISHEKLIAGKHTDLLLDIGSTLLAAGAHSGRINRNLHRIAEHWGYEIDIFFSFTGLIVTIQKKDNPEVYATRHKRINAHGANFQIVNEISLLSWSVIEDNMSPEEVADAMEDIKKIPHYPRIIILLGIGFACGFLCLLAKGDLIDACFSFVAAFCGIFVRQEVTKRHFNPMISILAASFVATFIAGMNGYFHVGGSPEKSLATSVLFLIPGVPLINSVIDLIEGYIPTSIARGAYGAFILLCIAVGMSLSLLLIGINNF